MMYKRDNTDFCSGLREDLVLLQYAGAIRLVGDLEEGDSFDRGHCFEWMESQEPGNWISGVMGGLYMDLYSGAKVGDNMVLLILPPGFGGKPLIYDFNQSMIFAELISVDLDCIPYLLYILCLSYLSRQLRVFLC
jgi:hypothetical protein